MIHAVSVSQNVWERREYKYLIPESKIEGIRAAAQSVCRQDSYAGPDGSYAIRSLYFDNLQNGLYWANEREQPDRYKVRVRSYPEAITAPVFLEVKRRVLDVIVKSRVGLPADRWAEVVAEPNGIRLFDWKPGTQIHAERFLSLVHGLHLMPRVIVEYRREAYVSLVDDYARLTFDRAVTCQLQDRLDMAVDERQWRVVDHPVRTHTVEPVCILELKFGAVAPPWMVSLVRRFNLLRFSFSKYCYSLEAQYLLPEDRVPTWGSRPKLSGMFES